MAEQHQLKGKEREAGLKALKTLDQLLRESQLPIVNTLRGEITALTQLLMLAEEGEVLPLSSYSTEEDKLRRLVSPESYEGNLIRDLAQEAGMDGGIFTEFYIDLFENRGRIEGRTALMRGQIEATSLEGQDITDRFMYQDFSEFQKYLYELIEKKVDKAYIKIDWDEVKNSREAKSIPGMLKAYSDSYFGGKLKVTCAIECTAVQYYHELPKIEGASNAFASGVKWIRKRKS